MKTLMWCVLPSILSNECCTKACCSLLIRLFAHSPNYMNGVAPYIRQQIDKLTVKGDLPASRYAVCYMWGTAGLLYNKQFVSEKDLKSWGVPVGETFFPARF